MTSALTLDKLRLPLEKEKEQLTKARNVVVKQLKVLQVS